MSTGRMIQTGGTEILGEKYLTVPHCAPNIPCELLFNVFMTIRIF